MMALSHPGLASIDQDRPKARRRRRLTRRQRALARTLLGPSALTLAALTVMTLLVAAYELCCAIVG
jgi:hypothetical protein